MLTKRFRLSSYSNGRILPQAENTRASHPASHCAANLAQRRAPNQCGKRPAAMK